MQRYTVLLVLIDLAAAAIGGNLAYAARFGASVTGDFTFDLVFTALLPLAWVAAIAANKAYEGRFVGVGNAEFERVFRAFLHVTVCIVVVFYAFNVSVARGLVFPALGIALLLDLLGRYCARKGLHRRRRHGGAMVSVIAVGDPTSLEAFIAMLRHDRYAGMEVIGACLPTPLEHSGHVDSDALAAGVPVLGDVDSIAEVVETSGATTVAVLSGEINSEKLRWISWQLEGTDTDLVVSPGLADFGGRRLHIQPVAGLPLLHIEEPTLTGFRRMLKEIFDRAVAFVALTVLSPFFLAVAATVRLTSSGPALFTQTRVGRDGREFRMVKFRSMVAGAETMRTGLIADSDAEGPLFKMRSDPRVTRVGRVLRRFSIDELPQLLNVLTGSMSLVGPRPPLPAEVEQYHDVVRRRLLVKPGITGLWQVSGRSDLSWDDSVRIDLRYVEDWSLTLDLIVLWKTLRAVFRADGAY